MAVAEQVRREFQTGFRGERAGIARNHGPAVDVVDQDESATWFEAGFQRAQGLRNILEMVEGGVADNAVERLIPSEVICVFPPIVNVWGGPLGAGNGEHRLRDVDGHDGAEMTGKLVR